MQNNPYPGGRGPPPQYPAGTLATGRAVELAEVTASSPSQRGEGRPFREVLNEKYEENRECVFALTFIGLLLLVILLPISFSYVEYYQYGLKMRKSTGVVYTDEVYESGRYLLGPDYTFKTYPADAQILSFEELSVFSAGETNSSIGLEFKVDIDLTYRLEKNKVGSLHKELADSYNEIAESRCREAIKNAAVVITFTEYFQERDYVESLLRDAVEAKLQQPPSLHMRLDKFFLGRVQIPESVAQKQLDVKIQNELNDKEENLKEAQLERDRTDVLVNQINLQADRTARIATANAALLTQTARADANKIEQTAYYDGFASLYNATAIETGEHKASFDYLRTLLYRAAGSTDLRVTYLDNAGVQETASADAHLN